MADEQAVNDESFHWNMELSSAFFPEAAAAMIPEDHIYSLYHWGRHATTAVPGHFMWYLALQQRPAWSESAQRLAHGLPEYDLLVEQRARILANRTNAWFWHYEAEAVLLNILYVNISIYCRAMEEPQDAMDTLMRAEQHLQPPFVYPAAEVTWSLDQRIHVRSIIPMEMAIRQRLPQLGRLNFFMSEDHFKAVIQLNIISLRIHNRLMEVALIGQGAVAGIHHFLHGSRDNVLRQRFPWSRDPAMHQRLIIFLGAVWDRPSENDVRHTVQSVVIAPAPLPQDLRDMLIQPSPTLADTLALNGALERFIAGTMFENEDWQHALDDEGQKVYSKSDEDEYRPDLAHTRFLKSIILYFVISSAHIPRAIPVRHSLLDIGRNLRQAYNIEDE
jgi:hypothetical protein